ncbi:rod shape-determining protein MreC [Desulfonispora thiosulfatigenes DSM 11270]|uniref:Cell shape-determining protein MreC n=1 Tax=Desulfonispora thiosulfatigenes DSM 11270 TaxID=656914 RepID=A0A1W1VFR7_DESTI|nr:rod shape-determining protein MreC [Desulfonispora thiosulfatigenes]SMB92156.1 rod shape-determining protein MreC [Desulfonispora thiosulfatigenes DSM 11270]
MSRKRKKSYIFIIVCIVLFVVFLNIARLTGAERDSLSSVEKGIKYVAAPIQNGATSIIQSIKDFFGVFEEVDSLRKENASLKGQISRKNNQINTLKDYQIENVRLRNFLEYKENHSQDFNVATAKVIARNPGNWYKTITINLGAEDGILKNMPIITPDGLVGRVISVAPKTSDVLLILDQEGAVGAKIWETRDIPGVVEGSGDGSSLLSMIYLPHDADIKIGHTIVTSGLGEIFPQGLRIGTIIEVQNDESGLMKKAKIKPFANFSRLEEVLVILKVKSTYVEKLPDIVESEDLTAQPNQAEEELVQ